MHSLLSLYLGDVVEGPVELPRSFTKAVTQSVFLQDKQACYVSWGEFVNNFPSAVRQRKVLWDTFSDIQGTTFPPNAPEDFEIK